MTLLNKPTLFLVATPIGNLSDISERAIDTLKQVDMIAAEDTRHSKKLLQNYSITTPLISCHKHNENERHKEIINLLKQGKNVALISDAGTPLISDPGYKLAKETKNQGFDVVPIPGPCAAIVALSASGLPTDKFIFEGFLSAKQNARIQRLEQLKNEQRTMIFYESTHRIIS